MQPDEMRRLRKALDYKQDDFADAIGMSRKAIVEMETGKAPIEQRTALAARQVYNERSRLFSDHEVKPMLTDIPLRDASILWDEEPQNGVRIVVLGRDKGDQRFTSSFGAGSIDWDAADDIGRLLRLLAQFVHWTVAEGIDPAEVHTALSVIPEYRHALDISVFDIGVGFSDD